MFEHLAHYRVILVSGPHRSGTTICAKMIAHDTGHKFLPEEAFTHDHVENWQRLIKDTQGGVIQCPSMCYRLTDYGQCDDVAVVMVGRNMGSILASQVKVGWWFDGGYSTRYRKELQRYGVNTGCLAEIKYEQWDRQQRRNILHPYMVFYESLSDHPLWIPKAERKGFGPRQVTKCGS